MTKAETTVVCFLKPILLYPQFASDAEIGIRQDRLDVSVHLRKILPSILCVP